MTDEYRKKLRQYYIQCFIMEGSKLILFSVIFSRLQLTKEYLFALFFLILLRTNGGGLHCKRYISCFLLSLSILALNIHLATHFSLHILCSLLCLCSCLSLCITLVPITSKKRPKPSLHVRKRCKLRTGILIFIFSTLYFLLPANLFLSTGFWAILLHTIQLLIAKITERRE